MALSSSLFAVAFRELNSGILASITLISLAIGERLFSFSNCCFFALINSCSLISIAFNSLSKVL
ncbi:hypothetical protein BMR02_08225 [Methylococcaceae bacterium HT1]|nr:hypothetical protein BMR02_08225 [Methylococcaceae bacterium HT1]